MTEFERVNRARRTRFDGRVDERLKPGPPVETLGCAQVGEPWHTHSTVLDDILPSHREAPGSRAIPFLAKASPEA